MHENDENENRTPRERWRAGPYVVDVEDGVPCHIWHITARAVTEGPRDRWTDRLLDMIDRTATRTRV